MTLRRALPLVLGVVPVAVAAACYGATSMRVEVLTDFTCGDQPHAAIYNGGEVDPLAATTDCRASDAQTQSLGDLLFAPKDDRSATVTVKVSLAVGPNVDPARQCKTSPDTCVFASRKFTYVEHESSHLTVRLYKDCLGKQCGDGQTCIQGGQCVSETVSCQGSNCGVTGETPFAPPAPPTDGGITDAIAPLDSGVPEAGIVKCIAPNGNDRILRVTPIPSLTAVGPSGIYWFDSSASKVVTLPRSALASTPIAQGDPMRAFDKPLALASDGTKPWLAFTANGELWAWNPKDGSVAVNESQGPNAAGMAVAPGATANASIVFIAHDGTLERLVEGQTPLRGNAGGSGLVAVTYDTTYVYAASADAYFVFFNTATPSPLGGSNAAMSRAMATNGTLAFAATTSPSEIDAFPGGAKTKNTIVANAPGPGGLAADATYVYWIDGSAIYRAPHGNGVPVAGTGTVAVVTPTVGGAALHGLYVDPATDGCIFAWSDDGAMAPPTPGLTIRVWPKLP